MICIQIPGFRKLELDRLVLDYNGTLAIDGELVDGVADRLRALSAQLTIHVVTADTFGRAGGALAGLPCELLVLPKNRQAGGKLAYVNRLGARRCACIGNGRNDRLMLRAAALGIAVVLAEGASAETLVSARVVATSITDALDLLIHPLRLVATLRS
jgi:soluble P-type ATPase